MEDSQLLTEAELLAALNVQADRTAVWRWRRQGMPHIKVGRSPRYDLAAVEAWLQKRTAPVVEWGWSVWTWVTEGRTPAGEVEPAFWYEECRCRNQRDAENIAKLFQKAQPWMSVRVSNTMPKEPSTEQAQPESGPPEGTSHE